MSKTAENNAQDTNAPEIRKGLYGVVVDETKVSKVVPETNSLTYRGYPVQELARYCSFEEVAYLLWNGRLPKQESLVRFSAREKALRHLDRHLIDLIDLITSMPKSCHPMDVLRTAVSFLGAQDAEAYTRDSEHVRRTALELMAKIPTIIALDIRRRRGEGYIEPSRKKGFAKTSCGWSSATARPRRRWTGQISRPSTSPSSCTRNTPSTRRPSLPAWSLPRCRIPTRLSPQPSAR